MFQDVNGSGTYDITDHPVANAMVRVGGLRVRTDSAGGYSSWSATPYERIEVELDTLSLEDPAWVPAVPSHFLRPSPHQFTGVAFPLVHTREVLGRLTPDSGMAVPAGVSLELRDSTTGGLYLTRTFGDHALPEEGPDRGRRARALRAKKDHRRHAGIRRLAADGELRSIRSRLELEVAGQPASRRRENDRADADAAARRLRACLVPRAAEGEQGDEREQGVTERLGAQWTAAAAEGRVSGKSMPLASPILATIGPSARQRDIVSRFPRPARPDN